MSVSLSFLTIWEKTSIEYMQLNIVTISIIIPFRLSLLISRVTLVDYFFQVFPWRNKYVSYKRRDATIWNAETSSSAAASFKLKGIFVVAWFSKYDRCFVRYLFHCSTKVLYLARQATKAKKGLIFPLKYLNKIFQKAEIFWWKWSSKLITVHWNRIVSDKIFFSKYFLCVCRLKYGLSILSLSLGLFYLSKDSNRKITQQANFGFSDPNFHLLTY